MKQQLVTINDKILLRKRVVVESVFEQLKHVFQIEQTRHRSVINAFVNITSALVSYQLKPKKTSIEVHA
jgi:Transposase DDE domain